MNKNDIKLGMRVRILQNGLTALIVGSPEYYRPERTLVRIKYENSTRYQYMIDNMIEPLPLEEQYVALGGVYVKPEGSF